MKRRRTYLLGLVLIFAVALLIIKTWVPFLWGPIRRTVKGTRTTAQVVASISPKVRPKLIDIYGSKGLTYPPAELTLIAIKDEKRLEIWSPDPAGAQKLVAEYKIRAASGTIGPKLKEGDRQVPEGFYSIIGFNPNSSYHLSMKLNYPNSFDKSMAQKEGRTNLGGDIFIHGYAASIGCLAIGNDPIEELFLLVYDVGRANAKVIITPHDFRKSDKLDYPGTALPDWTKGLYAEIETELQNY